MALPESWHIRSRSRECSATGRPFNDGEPIITALFPDPESSGYLRKDFAVEAWEARDAGADAPFSFWRARFVAPETVEKPDVVEKLSAEELLRRLVEEDEEHTENTRYILAVMLERQKLLRETDTRRSPTGMLRVYEHRKTSEVFIIKDPDIPLSRVEAVQQEVIVLLENGGRLPEPAVEAGTPENEGDSGSDDPAPTDAD